MSESRWVRRWPWLLIAAGAIVLLWTLYEGGRAGIRERYIAGKWRPFGDYPRIPYQDKQRIEELAAKGDVGEARRVAAALFRPPRLSKTDLDARLILVTRLDVQAGALTEDYLWSFMDPEGNEAIWDLALEQIIGSRLALGDRAGAIRLLEEITEGRHHHPVYERVPYPYCENSASERLSRLYVEDGDGRRALYWALKHRNDFAVHIEAFCGTAYTGAIWGIERLVSDAAKLAGVDYTPEPNNGWHNRLVYGPGWLVLLGTFYVSAALVLAGIWALLGGPFRRLFWVRRGPVVRVVLGAIVAAGLAPQLWLLVGEGGPPGPITSLWMALLAPAFVVPSIALYGACGPSGREGDGGHVDVHLHGQREVEGPAGRATAALEEGPAQAHDGLDTPDRAATSRARDRLSSECSGGSPEQGPGSGDRKEQGVKDGGEGQGRHVDERGEAGASRHGVVGEGRPDTAVDVGGRPLQRPAAAQVFDRGATGEGEEEDGEKPPHGVPRIRAQGPVIGSSAMSSAADRGQSNQARQQSSGSSLGQAIWAER